VEEKVLTILEGVRIRRRDRPAVSDKPEALAL
jgi:hypothetical protein